jgi:hypothetical protein
MRRLPLFYLHVPKLGLFLAGGNPFICLGLKSEQAKILEKTSIFSNNGCSGFISLGN